jgi:hypothetical protein
LWSVINLSKKLEILSSFRAGFGEKESTDVINGLFVAFMKLGEKLLFDFESRGSFGVDSKEIRKILVFDSVPKTRKNNEKFFEAGKLISKFSSDEIGWVAQYLIDSDNHLYPSEAKIAVRLQKQLESLNPK